MTHSYTHTLLRHEKAPKIVSKSKVEFFVLKDHCEVYIQMIKDEKGGTLSDEIIALSTALRSVMPNFNSNESISSRPFEECFTQYKTNSPGFLAAVLRKLGLLKVDPDDSERHFVADPSVWEKFKNDMLDEDGVPYPPAD